MGYGMNGLNGDTPTAVGISPLKTEAMAVLDAFPDEMRVELVKRKNRWLASFDSRLNMAKRDAVVLYAQLMRMIGEERNLSVLVINQIGVPPEKAKADVEVVRRASALDEHEKARVAARVLMAYCERNGIEGLAIPDRLQSGAEVVDDANG